mgnify:CR=1 FL=1
MKHFGHFVTESSEHFSEYTPWIIKSARHDLVAEFQVPLDEYITRCKDQIAEWEVLKHELEDESRPLPVERSNEYAAAIIHGMGTGALRDMVRRLLTHDKRIASFDFAQRQQGGTGVTIAVLR